MGTRIRENLLAWGLGLARRFDRRAPDPAELGTVAIRRILVMSCTAIGDTLLSTPAIRSLRQRYPQARIVLLVNAPYHGLFADNPDIDDLIDYHGGYRRFVRLALALRRERFDLVAILHANEPQATPLAYLSGARWRFKLPNNSRFRFLLSNYQQVSNWSDFTHGIDQRLAVAALAGADGRDKHMILPVSAQNRDAVAGWLQQQYGITPQQPVIGFQVGASTASRRWRPERYAELAQRLLAANPSLRIVVTGSPQERALADAVADAVNDTRLVVTAGELPLTRMPALVQRFACLVTPDTGIMHMAIAVGTPIVGLFAAAHWHGSGPITELQRHIVIQKHRTCDPCLGKRCRYAAPPCMDNITVDEVLAACERQLSLQPETHQ